MRGSVKIDNPTEETIVLGGRTLRQIVALMERLTGMFEVIDISEPEHFKAPVAKRTHFYANTNENLQWTMQHLMCDSVHVSRNVNPWSTPLWNMYIAHDVLPKGSRKILGEFVNSVNLSEAISRISYVITPEDDVTADIDRAEVVIASYEARLATIGEWKRLGLAKQVTCGCGRGRMLTAREVFSEISDECATAGVIKRLKCMGCGTSNVVEMIPYNRKVVGPISYTENPYNSWPEAPSLTEGDHIPGRQPTGRVDPLYVD
ncbi:hypothetical protein ACS5UA_22420 [Brucella sp. RRSP16]|uniref:hypothetical protein n=1 Tax=Brucella sp. RRSP16 TaxID=3453707 RepID=UPI003FCC9D3F